MPVFCITDKSLSMVLEVTDKISDICFAGTEGFEWIIAMIRR